MPGTPPDRTKRWSIGLALLCLLVLLGIGHSYVEVRRAERALAWPTAEATIVASTAGRGCGRSGNGYYVRVRYRYRVNGNDSVGDRIIFGASTCYSANEAKALMARFPLGSATAVRYDPAAADEAVLIPGQVDESTWTGIYFMTFWFVMLAMATGMVVVVERSKRNPSPGLPPQRELGGG